MKATIINYLQWHRFQERILGWVEEYGLPYYQGLALREKRIVLFAGVALPMMVFIFTVILPLQDARIDKRDALVTLEQQVLEAEALALRLKGKVVTKRGSSMSVIDQIARSTGVRTFMTRLRPQTGGGGQRMLVQMRSAPYAKIINFFNALPKNGLSLLQVKLQQAESPGIVHVQLVIE